MRYLYKFILFLSLNISSDNLYYFEDEYDENRFNNLIKDIRCPKCTSGLYQVQMLQYLKI